MNYKFIERICDCEDQVPLFKGYNVVITDEYEDRIPNLCEVKEKFDVALDTEKYTQPAGTLFSTLIDAKYCFILDSILGKSRSSERNLLKKHLENVNEYIDLNNTIIILNMGCYSLKLMLLFDSIDLKYIFRLRDDIYSDGRYGMKNDEYLNIKLTNNRTQNIKNEVFIEKNRK